MAPITTVGALVGVAKQASAGALAANPTFAHGIKGGKPINVEISETMQEVTTGRRASATVIREAARSKFDIQSPAYLKSLGAYLLGALGSVATTGTDPYDHEFALGDLPLLSVFGKGIDGVVRAIRDAKVDELTLKWDGSKPLELSVKGPGTVFSHPATFTPTVDETASESFLVPVGGTFEISPITGTPVSARVLSGELMVKNAVTTIDPAASIESGAVHEGKQDHGVKLTIVPDNLVDFRRVLTGADAGTSVAVKPTYGSLNLVFKENGGDGTLTVTAEKVAFLTNMPDVDPKGGRVELELAGMPVLATAAVAPVVYTLSNSHASY